MVDRRALVLVFAAACADTPEEAPHAHVRMTFTRPEPFAAPFPSDDLRAPDGTIALGALPNPTDNPFVKALVRTIGTTRGFATTGGVFFTTTASLDAASLPDLAGSLAERSPVSLQAVDGAPHQVPIHVGFEADGGPFGAPNMLSIVPLQGVPLRPSTTYAVVIRRAVRDATGAPLDPAPEMRALARGEKPAGMSPEAFDAYRRALGTLRDPSDVAALAVFTTGDPTAELLAATREATKTLPTLEAPPARGEVFDDYCVYNAVIGMPSFQAGTLPFSEEGGSWVLQDGKPVVQRIERARVVLTVPRSPTPAGGRPLAVMIRTGGGGERPLVDRGPQDAAGIAAPGTGLARELAKVGVAGASVDGPHGGLRNVTKGDEQFLVFNIDNVAAIKDNLRQTALETALFERVLEGLSFDASDCPGVGATPVRYDATRVSLIGHSMGATIAPLALAAEPHFRGAVLSGAGASWLENLLYKEKPLRVRPIIEILLGYQGRERTLQRGDIVLTLAQWALEPADPLVYAPRLVRAPRDGEAPREILMEQGIVDHYIMPTIANALSLSFGLDLAGDAKDETSPELVARPEQTPLRAVLPYSSRAQVAFPIHGPGPTAVVRQHPGDGMQDGHEVVFQTEPPKRELRCFLKTLGAGAPAQVTDSCD